MYNNQQLGYWGWHFENTSSFQHQLSPLEKSTREGLQNQHPEGGCLSEYHRLLVHLSGEQVCSRDSRRVGESQRTMATVHRVNQHVIIPEIAGALPLQVVIHVDLPLGNYSYSSAQVCNPQVGNQVCWYSPHHLQGRVCPWSLTSKCLLTNQTI